MSLESIRKFKRWYQVIKNGKCIAQFLNMKEAKDYIFVINNNRGISENTNIQVVNQHRGYTIRHINCYP